MRCTVVPILLALLCSCSDHRNQESSKASLSQSIVRDTTLRVDTVVSIDSTHSAHGPSAAAPDTAGVPVVAWAVPHDPAAAFVLPMHSQNFFSLASRVRFDSSSLARLRSARPLSVPGLCSPWIDDPDFFKTDFVEADATRTPYRVAWGRYKNSVDNPRYFLLVGSEKNSCIYLFTQQEPRYTTDTPRAGSVVLLQRHDGSGFWGYDRSCRMLAPGELVLENECWEYTRDNPKGKHFQTAHRLAITDSGFLRVAATLRNSRQ